MGTGPTGGWRCWSLIGRTGEGAAGWGETLSNLSTLKILYLISLLPIFNLIKFPNYLSFSLIYSPLPSTSQLIVRKSSSVKLDY
jgi:hypothetical protein